MAVGAAYLTGQCARRKRSTEEGLPLKRQQPPALSEDCVGLGEASVPVKFWHGEEGDKVVARQEGQL